MLKVAVLPFNAAEGVKPQLGRQISGFVADQVRTATGADIQSVSFLTTIEQNGVNRTAYVNISDGLLDPDQLKDLFEQSQVDVAMDGMLKAVDGGHELTVRFTPKSDFSAAVTETHKFADTGALSLVHNLIKRLASEAQAELPAELSGESMEFGTDDSTAFLKFLEGYDALHYIQQAQGMVAEEFNPEPPMDTLLEAIAIDRDFEGPYQVLVGLCRACTAYQIGTFELVESKLLAAAKAIPEEFAAHFALGELYQAGNVINKAIDSFEKAHQLAPNDPGILNRLGNAQMMMQMPVNAERSFRKALELEGDDKPSLDYLAGVLQSTNRAHEVPALWKAQLEANPRNAELHAKYALSLFQADRQKEGVEAFETGLETVEENAVIKRYYAPYLAQNGEIDRAMDFYEDCLDVAPTDVPLMLEYAQTLQAADRDFEIPAVLQNVLKANPDPNTRAQAQAWLIELEQPKRVETIEAAQTKLSAGDAEGAIRELKPLRNWLADYWKLWAMLSSAYNRVGDHAEAENSAKRLIEIYPGCEPAYGELREALNGQGKHEEAWQFMQWAFSQNRQSFGLFVNLGIAAKRANMTDEARKIAEQIRAVVNDHPEMKAELDPVLQELEA